MGGSTVLFDLRSRGRRRTVQGIYLGLAVVMGGGLILFGVGAGNGNGGLLNAFGGGGNGNAQTQQLNQTEKQAIAQTKANPNSASAWGNLLEAYYSAAQTAVPSGTTAFTGAPRHTLVLATNAWQHYQQLTKKPDPTIATVAANAYGYLQEYKNQAAALQVVTASTPSATTYYNLAVAAYQGKMASLGDLAAKKAIALEPKLQRLTLQNQLKQVRTSLIGSAGPLATPTSTTSTTTSTTPKSGSKSSSSSTKKKKK
jgi:hypothetical protein